jgi:hypothetical protein
VIAASDRNSRDATRHRPLTFSYVIPKRGRVMNRADDLIISAVSLALASHLSRTRTCLQNVSWNEKLRYCLRYFLGFVFPSALGTKPPASQTWRRVARKNLQTFREKTSKK